MVLLYVFIHIHNVNCKSKLKGYLEKCFYIMGVIVIETSFNLQMCITNLNQLNLVKFGNGGSVLGLSLFLLLPQLLHLMIHESLQK